MINSGYFLGINDAWANLVSNILRRGQKVGNTLELSNISFTITDITKNILTIRENFSLSYYLGESVWYGAGKNDVEFISKFGKIWEKLSDDGLVNNSAYGYILKRKHNFDQIEKMIELLKKDPNSRRAVMNINIPNENVIETKDEMCTIALQFLLRDGQLNMTGIMRSNDVSTGTPYDIFYFTELQKYVANELGVKYGTYTHFVSSVHIYDRDIEKIEASLRNEPIKVKIDGQLLLKNAEYMYEKLKDIEKKSMRTEIVKLSKELNII